MIAPAIPYAGMTPAMRRAAGSKPTVYRIRRRLVALGAFDELDKIDRLSPDEMDLLVLRETKIR